MKIEVSILISAALFAVVTAKPGSRVIGGQTAATGEFPYAAAIHIQTATSKFFCGGAVMRNRWVLTSATCVYNATLLSIQVGSSSLTESDSNRIIVATSEYIVHPDYNPETLENDIALVHLRMDLSFNDFLKNANFYVGTIPDGLSLLVLGWGQTSDYEANLSEHLQYVETTALVNAECKLYYGNQITDNMVCVEGNYNEGTCTGDNGGPLLRKSGNNYYVVGVASFISGNGCESTDPSGFTRTSPYYDWLRETMSS